MYHAKKTGHSDDEWGPCALRWEHLPGRRKHKETALSTIFQVSGTESIFLAAMAGSAELIRSACRQSLPSSSGTPSPCPASASQCRPQCLRTQDDKAAGVGLPTFHLLALAGGRENFPAPPPAGKSGSLPSQAQSQEFSHHEAGWHVSPQADPAMSSSKIEEVGTGGQVSYAPQ